MTALADAAMGQLRDAFTAAADPVRAPAVAAYMRDQFPFLGLPTPVQRRLARAALRGLPAPDEADAVEAFVATHDELSLLSAREALKWLHRKERV